MLKKTIAYVDYDGNKREETFNFNLSEAEIARMEMSRDGGLRKYMQRIVAEQNGPAVYALYEDLILTAYGVKSDDGRRFIKSQELRDSFSQTEAYSILMTELLTSPDASKAFVYGIFPESMRKEVSNLG